MKIQKIAIVLTVVNLILMIFLLGQLQPLKAERQQQNILPVLRGSGLEIVDSTGKLRASITMHGPSQVAGKTYPAGILFRLIDTKGQPSVKLEASSDGGGISLSEESNGYIQVLARGEGSFIRIKNADGTEKVIKP